MAEAPQRFPLAWPKHRPRTKGRKQGRFTYKNGHETKAISTNMAMERLDAELNRLGAQLPILSSNIELRLDGRPRSGTNPTDPGVALYFQLGGKPHTMACDTYTEVSQNIAALAAHIEATRAIERHGVATASEVLQAFTALPPPASTAPAAAIPLGEGVKWWEVFGVMREVADEDTINAIYRTKARASGGGETLTKLNMARDAALADIRSKEA
jgi:hypothetical protein